VRIVVVVMVVTALWLILGAVLHGGRTATTDAVAEPWWWESCRRSPVRDDEVLPPSHPLAHLTRSPSRSTG